ncbi:hypothetical protein FB451DRAFT_1173420 [Mycena latifolia]|nr:hypothetical protein FB451DRAFT_1173420 [Mycena latifolia]
MPGRNDSSVVRIGACPRVKEIPNRARTGIPCSLDSHHTRPCAANAHGVSPSVFFLWEAVFERFAARVAIETECIRALKCTRLVKEITTQQIEASPNSPSTCLSRKRMDDVRGSRDGSKRGWVEGDRLRDSRIGAGPDRKGTAPTIDGCGGKLPEEPRAL